jgi:CheY-like chemotaxis protein
MRRRNLSLRLGDCFLSLIFRTGSSFNLQLYLEHRSANGANRGMIVLEDNPFGSYFGYMKILITSTGVAGHLNPLLTAGSALSWRPVPTSGLLPAVDQHKACQFVRKALHECGFALDAVHDGEGALQAALTGRYDVIVPDILLPGRHGLSVLRLLRAARNSTPKLLFTARAKVSEAMEGLEPGTDDYVAKPIATRELVTRINALFRDGRSRRLAFCSGDPWFESLRHALRHELSLAVPTARGARESQSSENVWAVA